MAAPMIRRRRNHKAGINRLFRDQINPLKIFDDVESCVKFRSRRVRILAIVDELQEAVEHQLTRQAQPQCSDSDIATLALPLALAVTVPVLQVCVVLRLRRRLRFFR